MSVELRRPSGEQSASFAAMRDAFVAAGDDRWCAGTNHPKTAVAHTNVDAYIALMNAWSRGEDLPEGWVPCDHFWIVNDGTVVGEIAVRHRLTEWLRQVGGHIGYDVHPAHRNRGIATAALREALNVLAERGETEALITCALDNVASARVIEKCGGVRIEDSTEPRMPTRRRYVIALRARLAP